MDAGAIAFLVIIGSFIGLAIAAMFTKD